MGVSEINVKESVDSLLQLHATSYAIVQTMQQTSVNCLLRVLFDSGLDKTMLKQSALPPGIPPGHKSFPRKETQSHWCDCVLHHGLGSTY
jgi:hypothetical protein